MLYKTIFTKYNNMVFVAPKNGWKLEYEHSSDVGNHYCVNPYLYSVMSDFVEKQNAPVRMADIGAGTCSLAEDFLKGATYLPSFLNNKAQKLARKVVKFFCFEQDPALLFKKEKMSPTIEKVQHACSENDQLPLEDSNIDLATSRHFIMHLNKEAFKNHLKEVYRILKPGGKYLMVCLNPDYEQKKVGKALKNDESYLFPTANGFVEQHFKTADFIEKASSKFVLLQKLACFPITNIHRESHARYYDQDCPMAYLYIFSK